jgi:hypothetical protein
MTRFITIICGYTIVATVTCRWAEAGGYPEPMLPGVVEHCTSDCDKVCVPEPAKAKKVRTEYDLKCVDYCLPKCPHFSLLHRWGTCDTGCDVTCGKPRTRHVLVKRLITEERDSVKCVPQQIATKQ